MTTKAKVAKVEAQVRQDLEAEFNKARDAFVADANIEEAQALVEVTRWLEGQTHKPRPKPIVWAKAIRFRERMPHDLIESYRRLLRVTGTKLDD
jgi:hypothetical protein